MGNNSPSLEQMLSNKKVFKRGDVFWVNLDPTLGSETKKVRPGVIISNDSQNRVGQRVIIAPMTSVVHKVYPFEILADLDGKHSKIMLDQIRTVDCQRLGTCLGKLNIKEIEKLNTILKQVLELG